MKKYVKDVVDFDKYHNIQSENELKLENIIYNSLCLAGEAGEQANIVKKMWRDGVSSEKMNELKEELVDVVIFVCKLIEILGMDFDFEWEKKHKILYKRWEQNSISKRKEKPSDYIN